MGQYFERDIVRVTGHHLVIDRAHNEYLHIAVSSGIPAAFTYLAFEGTTLYQGFKSWRQSPMLIPVSYTHLYRGRPYYFCQASTGSAPVHEGLH